MPDREGYTFLGWYRSDDEGVTFEDETFDFSQVINEHLTIYSRFEIDQFKVTYKVDGRVVKEEMVPYGSDSTAPQIPAKEGYTATWDNDGTAIKSERTINAVYTLIQTPSEDGSEEDSSEEVSEEASEDSSEDGSVDDNSSSVDNNNVNNNNVNNNYSSDNNKVDGNLGMTGIVWGVLSTVAIICLACMGVLIYSKKREC